MTKAQRADRVNEVIAAIAGCGRQFFRVGERLARMEVDDRGRVWFVDAFTQKRIYTHKEGCWDGFSNGGTLRSLVISFRDFIRTGEQVPATSFGPWPAHLCGGDLWAYGTEAMERVRSAALAAGVINAPTKESA